MVRQDANAKTAGKRFKENINKGAKPKTKEMIIKMAVNGSGIRDTARVLGISKDTVMSVLKKLKNVSQTLTLST